MSFVLEKEVNPQTALDWSVGRTPKGAQECFVSPPSGTAHRTSLARTYSNWPAAEEECRLDSNGEVTDQLVFCARATRGHAAAPPDSVMKSRRFMSLPYRGSLLSNC